MPLELAAAEEAVSVHEAGIEVEILDPNTGEPSGALLTIVGPDSRRARRARQEAIQKLLEKGEGKVDGSELTTEILCRLVISWTGILRGDTAVECTVDNARAVFERLPWLEVQVERKAQLRANFTKG